MRLNQWHWVPMIWVVLVACTALPPLNPKVQHATTASAPLTEVAPTAASSGRVTALPALRVARAAHTATRLPDGKVLIAGGFDAKGNALASAERFDPTTNTFVATGAMAVARQSHSATLLPDGRVLIAGGYGPNGEYLASVEFYEDQTGAFTSGGQMTVPRAGQLAVLLNDGTVLLVGGVTTGWGFLASAERYDPVQNTFTPTGSMSVARESHTATLLPDGKVLVTGGHQGRRSAIEIYASAEVYDPMTDSFSSTAEMLVKRHKHDALPLADGTVLIMGGADERDEAGQYRSAELYQPNTGRFTLVSEMNATRYKFQGTSVQLQSGQVLLMGGADLTELYDPLTSRFHPVAAGVGATRLFAAAVPLSDGRVLLTGGYGPEIAASADTWVFQP